MKKVFVITICLICILSQTLFAESQNLNFVLSIEEDYGIVIPDDVLRLDRFVFEYVDNSGASHLLRESTFDVGSLLIDENETVITLLYYGNLSSDYEVVISGDMGEGWNIGDAILPVNISFLEAEDKPQDIVVRETRYGEASILVPATASRSSVPVVDLVLSWSGEEGLLPGSYNANFTLELSAI